MKNKHILTIFIFCMLLQRIVNGQCIEPGASQFKDYLSQLKNKHIGVVVNNASLIGETQLTDTLISLGIQVNKIYTPEHGFTGKAEAGAVVANDFYHNIPLISLYGNKFMPTAEDLKNIDIMVFDLQDVGIRFYTYLSTLHYIMKACAVNSIPLLVLDRPNPNGFYVDGPVIEDKYKSFVGLHTVPIVYGMTIGEYALMINGEDSLHCNLQVIPCKNYDHNSFFQLLVNPSPNLRTMRAIYLYPSLALFEGTVISVGRGTNFPFLVAGHPDYPDKFFSFVPAKTPTGDNPKWNSQICYGLDLENFSIDTLKYNPRIRLNFLMEMYEKLNLGQQFFNDYFDKLAGNSQLRKDIISGKSEREIRKSWEPDLEEFKKIRAKYLLYPDFK